MLWSINERLGALLQIAVAEGPHPKSFSQLWEKDFCSVGLNVPEPTSEWLDEVITIVSMEADEAEARKNGLLDEDDFDF